MKKRFLAALTALLCATGVMTAFPAAAEVSPDVQEMYDRYSEYAVETEDFTYRPFGEDVFLQSDAVKADLMVLGVFGKTVWVALIQDTLPENTYDWGVGTLDYKQEEYITGLDSKKLRPGDLLQADGGLLAAEIVPLWYHGVGGFTYAGNGVDIFGDAFQDVIRNQLLVLTEWYQSDDEPHKSIYTELSVLLSALDDDSMATRDAVLTDTFLFVPHMCDDISCGSLQFENVSVDADLIVVSTCNGNGGTFVLPIYAEGIYAEGNAWNEDGLGGIAIEGELQVGDLLKANGMIGCAESIPPIYLCSEGFTDVGNAVDLWGEEIRDVIRTQVIFEQTRRDKVAEEYGINSHIQLIASGDVDVNNTIDTSDASAVLQDIAAALMDSSQLSAPQFKAADVNGDDVLTVDDASILLQYIAAKLMDDSVQLSDFT